MILFDKGGNDSIGQVNPVTLEEKRDVSKKLRKLNNEKSYR
jgi:hypothetical protein